MDSVNNKNQNKSVIFFFKYRELKKKKEGAAGQHTQIEYKVSDYRHIATRQRRIKGDRECKKKARIHQLNLDIDNR